MEPEIKKSSNPLKEFISNLHLDVLTKEKNLIF